MVKRLEKLNIRWMLVVYDILIYACVNLLLLFFYNRISMMDYLMHTVLFLAAISLCRFGGNVYKQVWRFGGIQSYIRLVLTDGISFILYCGLSFFIPHTAVSFVRMLAISCMTLLGSLTIRMFYRYAYKCGNRVTPKGRFLGKILKVFSGLDTISDNDVQRIKVAIVGAGRVGVSLAEELINNSASAYTPRCFIDTNSEKAGKEIRGITVLPENGITIEKLKDFEIQEIIIAMHDLDSKKKKLLYDFYSQTGCKLKIYDYPVMQTAGAKRQLREFDTEELLFRKPLAVTDEGTAEYYKGKTVLITGGGGSIGSELCRQISKMNPGKVIILDVYENGAYEVQQELKMAYGDKLNLHVEIASITDRRAMTRVFEKHHPEIVIHAAAHKHVPLMENNPIEAIENNVFGTKNVVELCEEFEAERFMMVSTDKAVNPTNVMGATKRMCEMIVQSYRFPDV